MVSQAEIDLNQTLFPLVRIYIRYQYKAAWPRFTRWAKLNFMQVVYHSHAAKLYGVDLSRNVVLRL